MNRIVACIAVTALCGQIIGCGGPKVSAEKWHATSAETEADLTAAFGAGTPVDDAVRGTLIADYELPEDVRILQWTDPERPDVYFIAAIVDGKVEQQVEWHSQ